MSVLRDLLSYLIHSLVDDPQKVRLDCVETLEVSIFYVRANRGDVGRILGKQGQTIEDIRQVMEAVAARQGREVIIDMVDQSKRRSGRRRSPDSN